MTTHGSEVTVVPFGSLRMQVFPGRPLTWPVRLTEFYTQQELEGVALLWDKDYERGVSVPGRRLLLLAKGACMCMLCLTGGTVFLWVLGKVQLVAVALVWTNLALVVFAAMHLQRALFLWCMQEVRKVANVLRHVAESQGINISANGVHVGRGEDTIQGRLVSSVGLISESSGYYMWIDFELPERTSRVDLRSLPIVTYQKSEPPEKADPEKAADPEKSDPEAAPTCEEDQGEIECVFCLEAFENGDRLLKLPCNHIFHQSCVSRWLCRNCLCPVCKQDVSALQHKSRGLSQVTPPSSPSAAPSRGPPTTRLPAAAAPAPPLHIGSASFDQFIDDMRRERDRLALDAADDSLPVVREARPRPDGTQSCPERRPSDSLAGGSFVRALRSMRADMSEDCSGLPDNVPAPVMRRAPVVSSL
eukprot:TRINITY_DN83127_c0_g1_i1.p1 TRINITY_DN83127_c0_g1~~TRINITY_DN83127_c0_g1_i1.p1  ORF type:complete len:418 (+),score=72.55 TRINITY_DN83127_c0_g1_i1:109-1362(+)